MKPGPKPSPKKIRKTPTPIRWDEETEAIVGKHLARMRGEDPRASVAQFVRLAVVTFDKDDRGTFIAELQRDNGELQGQLAQAQDVIQRIQRRLQGYETKLEDNKRQERERLLRAMRSPKLVDQVVQDLQQLVDAEAGGLTVPPRIPLLKEARAAWGSYAAALEALRGAS